MQGNDRETNTILFLLACLVLSCVIGAITLGISLSAPQAPQAALDPASAPLTSEALALVYFETGSARMPEESGGAIQTVVGKANEQRGLFVLISGFHDPSGDPEQNAILAKARAEAARQELINAGLAAERIVLRKPEMIPGTEDMQEARRVEFRIQ